MGGIQIGQRKEAFQQSKRSGWHPNGATLAEVAHQPGHAPGSPMTRRYAKFISAAQQSIASKAQEAMSSLLEPQEEIFAETSWASLYTVEQMFKPN